MKPGKVLVSACLLGDPVRHDGRHKLSRHAALLMSHGILVLGEEEIEAADEALREPA